MAKIRKKKSEGEEGTSDAPSQSYQSGMISSFLEHYAPEIDERMADEVMNVGALRRFFGCYYSPDVPDALPGIINYLEKHGFHMQVLAEGGSGILCRIRRGISPS